MQIYIEIRFLTPHIAS